MQRLDLDFHRGDDRSTFGTLLLAAGVVLAGAALLRAATLREEGVNLESRASEQGRTARRASPGGADGRAGNDDVGREIALVSSVLQRLALPWDNLFSAIESVRNDKVALISIEPSATGATVKVTAEARTTEDMLEYVRQLQGTGAFRAVTLINHQVRREDPQRPVRFVLDADWSKQP